MIRSESQTIVLKSGRVVLIFKMSSLISSTDKLSYANVFNDIHDTFSRKIVIWKTPKKVIISSNHEYNFLYSEQQSPVEYETVPVSGVFDARILWGDPTKLLGNSQIKEEVKGNVCRLKVKKEVLDFLADASQIDIDGRPVEYFGSSKPHGLFENDFFTLFFKESN